MTSDKIINAVLDHFDMPAEKFITRNRDKRAERARAICAYLLRTYGGLAWKQVAHVMQRPSHSSVVEMYQRIDASMMDDQALRDEVGAILNRAAKAS